MLKRSIRIDRAAAKKESSGDLTVSMAFASEEPYERWWGIEILDTSDGSVRLDRLNDGANVLFNHNPNDLRGVHVRNSVHTGKDKVLRGDVRLTSATGVGRDTIALVETEVLTKASVGYRVHKVVQQTTGKTGEKLTRELDGQLFERLVEKAGDQRHARAAFYRSLDAELGILDRSDAAAAEPDVFRIIDWEPYENSLVTIPADATVGVGRSADLKVQVEVRDERAESQPAAPAAHKEHVMTPEEQAAADAAAGKKLTAAEAEKQRRQAVINYCKASKIDPRVEARWIEEGTPLEEISTEILKVLEERGKQRPLSAAALGLSPSETRNYSLFRAIRALRNPGDPRFLEEAAFERECSIAVTKRLGRPHTANLLVPSEVLMRPLGKDAAERAMSVVPGAKGGYMVAIDQMGFIDILRNRSVAMAMGARVISGLQGNVTFPRQTGKPTVTWQGGEGVSVTAADQTLGQLSMTPKTCIAITDVSEQLLAQASPSAEAFVMADLAADVAIDGVDAASINGTGGAQPLGIKNTTGITSGQDAASATYAKILAFVSTAGGANAILGNPGWVTNTAGAAKLMQVQRFSSTDTPLWTGNMLNGVCVGFNAMSSEQLASGNLIFGSWDQLVIGEWGVLELATDNGGTRFNQAQMGIRAMWMVDILLRYPQAFVVSTNLS